MVFPVDLRLCSEGRACQGKVLALTRPDKAATAKVLNAAEDSANFQANAGLTSIRPPALLV